MLPPRVKVVFRIICCAAFFSGLLGRGSSDLGWMQAYLWCVEKHISVVSHLFRFFNHFTDTDGTAALATPPSTAPLQPRLLLTVFFYTAKAE